MQPSCDPWGKTLLSCCQCGGPSYYVFFSELSAKYAGHIILCYALISILYKSKYPSSHIIASTANIVLSTAAVTISRVYASPSTITYHRASGMRIVQQYHCQAKNFSIENLHKHQISSLHSPKGTFLTDRNLY